MRNSFRLMRGFQKFHFLPVFIVGGAFLVAGSLNVEQAHAAVCGAEPATITGKSTQTITAPTSGTYTIWSRMKAPDTSPVEYKLYVDGQCFTVGQTALAANTLSWVDYENGLTSDKATLDLLAGSYTLVLTAGTENLELDRVMLLSDGCTPTGTGDNCLNDTALPTTSITSPSSGATIGATSTVQASATDNDAIDYVEFYRGGTTLLGTDNSAPYSYAWNTTSVTDGAYSLTVRSYDLSGNVQTSAPVNVTVNNAPPVNANISSFTATPSIIAEGQSSTLSWSVSAGTGCSVNNGVGAVGLSGSQPVTPAATTAYTLTCNGQNGGTNDTAQATVTVNPAPVNANITSFTTTPSTITTGQSSNLSWSVSAGQNCSIDNSIGPVSTSGTQSVSPTVTTTYTLTCQGLNGGTSDTAQSTVTYDTSPIAANISSFAASPTTIVEGQSSTLSWSVSIGQNCSVDQGVGSVATSGTQNVSPVTTTTYTLTCDGLNGGASDTAQATLTVTPAPVNANISSFTVTPSTITEGQSATLNWTVATGQNCSINQGIGAVALNGSQLVTPSATATFTLTCSGLNGGANDSETVSLTVGPAPINANISSFSATPASITDIPGQSSTLAWVVTAGTSCNINQGVGSVATTGSTAVSPTSTTLYTLTCDGQFGGAADTAQVTVTVVPSPDTDDDGTKDYVEDAAPNDGDANNDAIDDSLQTNVVSLINAKTAQYNTIVAASDCSLLGNASSLQGQATYILGAWSFVLTCQSSGQNGQVEILLDKQYDSTGWKVAKVNTAMTTTQDVSPQVVIGIKLIGSRTVTSITYTATDGGAFDEDGLADGTIIDPIAVLGASTDQAGANQLSNTGESAYIAAGAGVAMMLIPTMIMALKLAPSRATIRYYTKFRER